LDYSTFHETLARNEINFCKLLIKDLYRIDNVYKLEPILNFIKENYPKDKRDLFDNFFVYKALDELIPLDENDFNNFDDTIYNKFNVSGYLIYRSQFYIFQPFHENEDVPMYYRSNYNKSITNYLTLNTFVRYNFTNKKETKSKEKKKKKLHMILIAQINIIIVDLVVKMNMLELSQNQQMQLN
jgi:hypothetical protein